MAQAGVSANRLELLQIADAVAREKAIDRQVVIMAMEDAIQKAAKSRYGSENEIKAEVDPKTGEIRLARLLEVIAGKARQTLSPDDDIVEPGKQHEPVADHVGQILLRRTLAQQQAAVGLLHRSRVRTEDRVVLKKMSQSFGIGKIVDGNELQIGIVERSA